MTLQRYSKVFEYFQKYLKIFKYLHQWMSSWLQLSTIMDTLDEMKKATPYISFYFLDIMLGYSGPDVDSEYLYFSKSGLTTQIVYNVKIMVNNGHSVNKVLTVVGTFQQINLPQVGGSTLLSSRPKRKNINRAPHILCPVFELYFSNINLCWWQERQRWMTSSTRTATPSGSTCPCSPG